MVTTKITGSREERTGRISGMVRIKLLLLIKSNQMPATASVRRTVALLGAKTEMGRGSSGASRSLGAISRD